MPVPLCMHAPPFVDFVFGWLARWSKCERPKNSSEFQKIGQCFYVDVGVGSQSEGGVVE